MPAPLTRRLRGGLVRSACSGLCQSARSLPRLLDGWLKLSLLLQLSRLRVACSALAFLGLPLLGLQAQAYAQAVAYSGTSIYLKTL